MNQKFQIFMKAVEDDLLEEAMTPRRRSRAPLRIGVAAAACLLIVLTGSVIRDQQQTAALATLTERGYDMTLPDNARNIRYELMALQNSDGAQASFTVDETEYVYQAVKAAAPQPLIEENGAQLLHWNAAQLEIQLLSSDEQTSVSWYSQDDQTQCRLTACAAPSEVLTTAHAILEATGLNVAAAPADAEAVTFNAFAQDGLTVAETVFVLDGITYTYRMAATAELEEDFADLSGLELPSAQTEESNVAWCSARISYCAGAQGKIIWFDVVPGLLYSLTMDDGASQEALLDMANTLFEPAQGDS